MEESKLFDVSFNLPDGFQVQMMVLMEVPEGPRRVGAGAVVYRSRLWMGHQLESDPMLYRSQEHREVAPAIDACYAMLLESAQRVIISPSALAEVERRVERHLSPAVSNF